MTPSQLMEQGIRAYTRGQLGEAERCWRDVLAVEPQNARAQSYLELLVGKVVGAAVSPVQAAPVPLPAPAALAPRQPARSPAPAPVPLPAPATAAWMQPPVLPAPAPPPPAAPAVAPLAPAPDTLAADEFASCWERDRGEITEPITIAPSELPLAAANESADVPRFATLTASGSLAGTPSLAETQSLPETPSLAEEASPLLPPRRTTLSEYAPSPWDQGPASAPAVVIEDGVGLDFASVAEQSGLRSLVPEAIGAKGAPRVPRDEVEIWMDGARELFALGDFSGSLEMIEKILKIDPAHAEAREYLKQNEATLIAMYESKLGPGDAIPKLAIQPEEVMWLNLDHRAGFLLAQIDGTVSYEDLFALSGLPRLDTARILANLAQEGVIKS